MTRHRTQPEGGADVPRGTAHPQGQRAHPGAAHPQPQCANPQRLSRSEALTCDQDHEYTAEQNAFDGAKMDRFVENTETASCSPPQIGKPGLVMDYYLSAR